MVNSILHTTQVPAFDRVTGQLSFETHHLVAAPLGYTHGLPRECTLLFDLPPAQPYDREHESTASEQEGPPKRKRRKRDANATGQSATPIDWLLKRQHESTTDHESDRHHASIVLDLEHAIDAVRTSWIELEGDNPSWTGSLGLGIRSITKDRSHRRELDLIELVNQATQRAEAPEDREPATAIRRIEKAVLLSMSDLAQRLTINRDATAHILPLQKENGQASPFRLVLPPSSGFLLSNFDKTWSAPDESIAKLGVEIGGWDMVIMDPPWPNTSVTRSSSYETFDPYQLWDLDLPSLLGPTKPVLVVSWLTNRVKYRRLLLEKLFPKWNIESTVEWYWVKIAKETGSTVWSLDSKHRRCYEGLVLGWYNPTNLEVPVLPARKVFLSTPIGHSRKPVLMDWLIPLLPPSPLPPNVLELFARTTLAGPRRATTPNDKPTQLDRGFFLAVGNEAIKFNLSVDEERQDKWKGWIELEQNVKGEDEVPEEQDALAKDAGATDPRLDEPQLRIDTNPS
ncbi:uncharacterized protein JCM15063_006036 [Sporobolomyces koalae]|uniref:uncharacterized protein n=1 Tax=Sporobolomyces koalae TaxID=500713 RepID=UPI00317E68D1